MARLDTTRPSAWWMVLGASVALGVIPARALADDSAGASADILYQQGKTLMGEDKAAEACPKFEASYKLEKKLGTLLNWSDCLEKINRVASAYARFDEAVAWATRENDTRLEFATTRRDALKPRLPHLRLDVKLGQDKLAIYENDELVDPSHYGLELAVDPGPIVVSVKRGEDELEKRTVTATEGAGSSLDLDLDTIAKAHPRLVTVPPPKGQRIAGFVVGGVGLAGLVAFAALEGAAYEQKSQATSPGGCRFDDGSETYICTPKGYEAQKRAGDLAEAGQWVGIGSGVVVAVGITLLATAPRAQIAKPEKAWIVVPIVSPEGTFGLVARGTL